MIKTGHIGEKRDKNGSGITGHLARARPLRGMSRLSRGTQYRDTSSGYTGQVTCPDRGSVTGQAATPSGLGPSRHSMQGSLFSEEASRREGAEDMARYPSHHLGTVFELFAMNVVADARDGFYVDAGRLAAAQAVIEAGRSRRWQECRGTCRFCSIHGKPEGVE